MILQGLFVPRGRGTSLGQPGTKGRNESPNHNVCKSYTEISEIRVPRPVTARGHFQTRNSRTNLAIHGTNSVFFFFPVHPGLWLEKNWPQNKKNKKDKDEQENTVHG